ncbi:MAG: protease modulator HflC, partial [Alphaproteobacteria bacterium]
YRIVDPEKFYQTVSTESGLRIRLARIINASLRSVIGGVTLSRVLSEERAEIMTNIKARVNEEAARFGIDVIDVRLRRTDLPAENSEAVYSRMKSEREREAKEFRAQGAEFGQRIRAGADRERTVLIAEAQREGQILRGDGDALSVKIYADAFGKDPEFFAFYRSMEAYRKSLGGDDTTMVLSPDSDYFRFFGNMAGAGNKPRP